MTVIVKCNQCGIKFLKPLSEIKRSEQRGYKNSFCSNKCSRIYNNSHVIFNREKIYYENPKLCLNCKVPISYSCRINTYCSQKCSALHTQKDGGNCHWSDEDKKRLSEWGKKYAYRTPKNGSEIECPTCGRKFYKSKKSKRICCSRKCTIEWINKTGYMKGKTGGYRPHSGTSKKGWYKGIFCGSSWELAWVIYHLEHNINFVRNNKGFPYLYGNKVKKYYPDFYLPMDDKYIEVKNYCNSEVQAKTAQFPYKLDVLYKEQLKDVFGYVIGKYGKDYIELYEPKKKSPSP